MAVSYISPGEELSASAWNDLFAAADAQLTTLLAGNSLLLIQGTFLGVGVGGGSGSGQASVFGLTPGVCSKCFFFGQNPLTDARFGFVQPQSEFGEGYGPNMVDYFIYNHAPFLDYAANGALDGKYDVGSRTLGLAQADASHFVAAGFPSGTTPGNIPNGRNGQNGNGITGQYGANVNQFELLQFSLQAHTRVWQPPGPNPPPPASYNLWESSGGAPLPQFRHAYDAVELVFTQSANVPAQYDKYNFFRLHNLSASPITVTIETWSATIPAHGSKCVRRTKAGGAYTAGYNYLWKMLPGDPRMFFPRLHPSWSKITPNNVTNPNIVATILTALAQQPPFGGGSVSNGLFNNRTLAIQSLAWDSSQFQYAPQGPFVNAQFDAHQFWDASALYCGGNLFGPMGGYAGDLIHHQGTILSLETHGNQTWRRPIYFQGWESLIAAFAAAGLTVTYNPQSAGGLTTTPRPPTWTFQPNTPLHDLLDVSSNLITVLSDPTGGSGGQKGLLPIPAGGLVISGQPWSTQALVASYEDGSGNIVSKQSSLPYPVFAQYFVDYQRSSVTDLTSPNNICAWALSNGGPGTTRLEVATRFTGFGFMVIVDVFWPRGANGLNATTGISHPAAQLFVVQYDPNTDSYFTQVVLFLPGQTPVYTSDTYNFGNNPFAAGIGPMSYDGMAVNYPRSEPSLLTYRQPAYPPAFSGEAPNPDFYQPNWSFVTEQSAPIQDDQVQVIKGLQDMTGHTIWRFHTDQSPTCFTFAYAAKTKVKLLNGSVFPVQNLTYDFTGEVDGPNPPAGTNAQYAQARTMLLANPFSQLEGQVFTDGQAGIPMLFEHMAITVEHYNNIASLVNAVFVPDWIFTDDPRANGN